MILNEDLVNNHKKIMYILFANIFTLWAWNIQVTHITKYLPDSLHYIKNLSIYYWLGIVLILIAFILNIYVEKKSMMKAGTLNNLLLIAFAVLYLHGTASFIYTNPRILDVYDYKFIIDNIYRNDIIHSISSSSPSSMYITQFQGATLFYSIILQFSRISSFTFSKYYTIYLMTAISVFIYIIAKRLCKKYYIIAPIAYLSLGWVQEYNLAPQSYSLTLSIILLYLVTLFLNKYLNEWAEILLMIIIWSAICISHVLTPIINIFSFIIMYGTIKLLEKIYRNRNELTKTISSKNIKVCKLTYTYTLIFVSYSIYISSFVTKRLDFTINQILDNLKYGDTFVVIDRAVLDPSSSYLFAYNIRMATTLFVIISGLICLLGVYFIKKDNYHNGYIGGAFLGYLSLGIALVISGYNTYGADRCYIFLLIPYSILCSMLLNINTEIKNMRKKILYSKIMITLFILISVVIFPVTQYASDPYNFVSESEITGKNFCLKFQDNSINEKIQIFPVSFEDSYYTFHYNLIEMKSKNGAEYVNKINSRNIIYNSGQYKTSRV